MEEYALSQRLQMILRGQKKVIKLEAKCWFLKICERKGLTPKTLEFRNKDPRLSQENYKDELRDEWKRKKFEIEMEMVKIV